jgi:hypothetical protein
MSLAIQLVRLISSLSLIDQPTISVIMPRTKMVHRVWCLKPFLDPFTQLKPSASRKFLSHIYHALFLLTLTTNQQEMFASIMEFTLVLNEKASQQRLLNTTLPLSQTSPLSSMQDFRNRYLRDPQSIVSNLACPEIHFRHGDAYASVRDCIANLLAHG